MNIKQKLLNKISSVGRDTINILGLKNAAKDKCYNIKKFFSKKHIYINISALYWLLYKILKEKNISQKFLANKMFKRCIWSYSKGDKVFKYPETYLEVERSKNNKQSLLKNNMQIKKLMKDQKVGLKKQRDILLENSFYNILNKIIINLKICKYDYISDGVIIKSYLNEETVTFLAIPILTSKHPVWINGIPYNKYDITSDGKLKIINVVYEVEIPSEMFENSLLKNYIDINKIDEYKELTGGIQKCMEEEIFYVLNCNDHFDSKIGTIKVQSELPVYKGGKFTDFVLISKKEAKI